MSWVAAGVGAATVVSGLVSGSKASKAQKQELALRREALEFEKQRYNQANSLYGDSIKGLVSLANQDVNPDLGGVTSRALADVTTQFGNSQEIINRNNARMGVNPNSGVMQSQMRRASLSEALAKAGVATAAREQERLNADNKHWNRLNTVATLGVNQINGTAAGVAQSTNSLANQYGSNADYLNNAASSAIGSGLGMLANANWGGTSSSVAAPRSASTALPAMKPS
ncbi:hypothetical protein [Acinetobacter modestus]|uniref:hypothetical protein n=1 Tax=Acinetobacter modestus TaxID=1776740 RepID=UPI003017BE9D